MNRKNLLSVAVAGLMTLGVATAAVAKSPVPGKPGKQNIVELAVGATAQGQFEYLVGAATCEYFGTAVTDLLSGGSYTLFAPTDAAFRNLLGVEQPPAGAAEPTGETFPCAAFEATPDALLNILTYHVTDGRRFSNSVFNRKSVKMIEMLNGQYVVSNPNKTLTDNNDRSIAVVVPFNVNASNGVIHAIDKVLLP
jgi:uncharacterized surface protein with fasciclin (FAS1) repeats